MFTSPRTAHPLAKSSNNNTLSPSEQRLFLALDDLFIAATNRYGQGAVDDFILRTIMEATLPMAPPAAKDRARLALREGGRTAREEKDRASPQPLLVLPLLSMPAFRRVMYQLFTEDKSTVMDEFMARIASETRRLTSLTARGNGRGGAVEGGGGFNGLPAVLLTNAERHQIPLGRGEGMPSGASDDDKGKAAPTTTVAPTTASPSLANDQPTMSSHQTQEQTTSNDRVRALENELSQLKAKYAAAEEEEKRSAVSKEKEGAPSAQPLLPSDNNGVPLPSDTASDSVVYPPASAETASSPSLAVMALKERCAATEAALQRANAKLQAYGGFYDRRGDVIHNARMIAEAARQRERDRRGGAAVGGGGMMLSDNNDSSRNTAMMMTMIPTSAKTSTRASGAAAGMTSNEALEMLLSGAAHPSPPSQPYPRGFGGGGGDSFTTTQRHQQLYAGGSGNSSTWPASSAYGGGASPQRQQQHLDCAAVSVALPPTASAPPSDTVLSLTAPIDSDGLRHALLGTVRYPTHTHLQQQLSNSYASSPRRDFGGGGGGGVGVGGHSRLDGMYHILSLEKQETNRWRSYGVPPMQ